MHRNLKHPVYRLNALPQAEFNYFVFENEFSGKKIKAYTGTIIRRPGTGSNGIIYHYCLFYGFVDNVPYVLHNDKYGAECISFDDYLEGRNYEIVEINPYEYLIDGIIDRVKERGNKIFHLKLNNCEHFAYYGAYGELRSTQAQMTGIAEGVLMFAIGMPVYMSGDEMLISKFTKWKKAITKPPKTISRPGRD